MKSREVVTKENYKQIALRRMIIVCWILLAVCFIVKIFGGNFFNIVCENERFIKVCTYIENTFWYYVVSFITSAVVHYMVWALMFDKNKFNTKETIILSSVFIFTFIIQSILYYFGFGEYVILMSLFRYIIFPLIMKCNWKRVIIVNIFDIIFQLISMFVKNVEIMKFDTNVIIALIFMIDYYIMFIITMLYSNQLKIRRENMGMFGGWFLHKNLAELEALLPTLKDANERKACEKRIAKLKEKK